MTLNILFPQWQGSGIANELYHGAMFNPRSPKKSGTVFFKFLSRWIEPPTIENKILA